MFEARVKVGNKLGLHARPAALLVQTAERFKSHIMLVKDGLEVNAKSIMGVMMLAAEMGSEILIRATGEDEREAVEELVLLVKSKFGEE
ncbi:MAG TPA: HPr family phosphocarrier protein [Candidatus Latescibacteria bacterium]|nr:HPr family phosphocarrier protein [Candidatus Latescibacterota bacterium]